MSLVKNLTTSVLALAVAAPVAAAELSATAITDLNIRKGPGPDFDIVGVIDAEGEVEVHGCLEEARWCEISYNDIRGWSFDEYLTVPVEAEADPVRLSLRPAELEVETVTYTRAATDGEQATGAAAGATLGALAAYALGGPAGAIVASGIFGAAAGAEASDTVEESVTYVKQNPVDTIFLEGEVVVGAAVPVAEVETFELPTADGYRYLTVNNVPVIIDAETGVIVEIVRL